ncbi:MAG TPA: site-specific DNA-methyltransferase [Anaerolineae bacterium]|nr:site-specific DNA-methyltransferase [Anaerolineae bacterium]
MKRSRRSKPFARLEWHGRREPAYRPASLQLDTEAYPKGALTSSDFSGQLILGDNLTVMTALLTEWEGQIDLIYVDPPFLTGKAYSTRIGRGEDSRRPSEWQTVSGYQDTWRDGAEYLDMLYPRLDIMRRLLSPSGTIYLHLDWHASAYARVLMDEIFGPNRLLNEIVWIYHGPSPIRRAFKRKHDTILVYTKSKDYNFNADAVRVAYDPSTVKTFSSSPKAGFGKVPDLERGKVPEDWWYFPVVARLHKERTGYPTQKPEALIERIILASSNPGDIVADFFCGSGTTAVVASRLGRQWIACDSSPLAIHTTYRRLLLENLDHPFTSWRSEEGTRSQGVKPLVTVSQSGSLVQVALEDIQSENPEGEPFPANINIWEVDWEFDGDIFRSRSQAVRSWREDEIGTHLKHTYQQPGDYTLGVRAFDNQGLVGLITHQITLPT